MTRSSDGARLLKGDTGVWVRGEGLMQHYRVNKVTEPEGKVLKKKDILAADDGEAMNRAAQDDDCPTCDVYRSGSKIGSIT